jgi:sulfur carrier protein
MTEGGSVMASASASIRVNGADEPLSVSTIAALLAAKEIGPERRGVAVALNGTVVPRARWAETALTTGDIVEIVLAKQGG